MAMVNGWFAYMVDQATLVSNVPGESADGWIVEGTLKTNSSASNRWLTGASPTTRIAVGNASGAVDWVVSNNINGSWINTGARYDSPCFIRITSESGQKRLYTESKFGTSDDGLSGSNNSRFEIAALNGTVGNDIDMSHAKIIDSSGTVLAEWNGNFVLNAARDGFVTRSAANADPSIAESGFNLKFYDISGNGHHATLNASTTWSFVSSVELPETLTSGQQSVSFSVGAGFNVTSLTLGGVSLPFTFDAGTGQGTFDAPALGNVSPFPLFGESVQLQLTDSSNGNTAESNVNWQPAAPYVDRLLQDDPDASNVNNGYYQWQDPPLAGNMAVFNRDLYNIESGMDGEGKLTGKAGKLSIEPDAPASFAVTEYLIDENGMQEFERNSSAQPTVGSAPTLSLNGESTVRLTEGDDYTDPGANWTDAEDGSGTIFSADTLPSKPPTGNHTQSYQYIDSDGNASPVRTRTVIVEAAPVLGEFTATHQNVPDGQIETVVVNLDTSEVLFNGMKSWANGQATFSFENLADGSRIQVSTLNETDLDGGLSVEYAA